MSAGFERFIASIFTILLICHLVACFWNMLDYFFENPDSWQRRFNFVDSDNIDVLIKKIETF